MWKKVLPNFVNNFKGFEEADVNEVKKNCVKLGNELNLDIDDSDVQELLDSHDNELTNEDL